MYTALQKFGNGLEKCGGQYQHKSLLFLVQIH